MNVDPKRHDDHENTPRQAGGEKTASAALPPTLFTLPNLAESAPCPTGSDRPVGSETPVAGKTPPGCEGTAASENASCGERKSPLLPPAEDCLPVVNEIPIDFQQIPDDPTEYSAESSFGSKEKLLDIWGSRSTVIGLLVLAVTLALIAARKAGEHAEQPTVAQDDAEELMLEGFAISEGVEFTETDNDAPSDADAMLAAAVVANVESSADESNPAASEMELAASTTPPAGPTAVLSAPLPEPSAVESSAGESSADESPRTVPSEPRMDTVAITKNDATFGPAERVSATTASSRSDTGVSLSGTPRENEFAMTTDAPANTITAEAEAPEARQQPSTATNADSDDSTAVEMTSREIANKPATSESVRYSETPNGISDLIRFLPPLPTAAADITPTP